MIHINFQDSRPIYEQIVDGYKHLILAGVLEQDERMPSVRALAVELSTNPNTVQKAFMELEREGFIYSVRGRGNFVKGNDTLLEKKQEEMIEELAKLLVEARELGLNQETLIREAVERAGNGGQ
ncbi:GntR family transcriptional regulator [Lachnospiraceae bacterium A10]|nr:GntR family transcriptional regulator [Lachnospiraceae bacterium A10]